LRLRAAQQLFLTYLVLIAAVVVALSFGAESVLRRYLTATATADLERELALGRTVHENVPELSPDSVADLLGSLSGRRVTIIAPDGTVTGDSRVAAADLPKVENHLGRPEVRDAFRGGLGFDQRISPTLGTGHLYLARRTDRGEVIRFALPTEELDAAIRGVQRTIFSVGAAALLLAVLFSFGFSLLVTRPLRTIAAAARRMSGGSLSQRIRFYRGDELGDLADALNTLASELQRRLSQLEDERAEMQALIDSMTEAVLAFDADATVRRANPAAYRIFRLPPDSRGLAAEAVDRRPDFLGVVNRAVRGEPVPPTELTYHGRHLLATGHPLPGGGAVVVFLDVSELRRLEGVRRDFVANASHELKTPLTAIRGYSETLLDDDLPPGLRQQFAETVKTNADRLQRIIDDLLDLSRLESGGWRVAPGRIALEPLVREVWSSICSAAPDKRLDLQVQLEAGTEAVTADPGGLRQILVNLLSNAARYTGEGGTITVRARRIDRPVAENRSGDPGLTDSAALPTLPDGPQAGPRVVIEVSDTGAGIPFQHLPRIFERFYRVDPARSRAEGGTGLGLAIVKHLVEAHGGSVNAESELGRGTTIRLTLPAEQSRPPYGAVMQP
jgi:two-component system, OmpR family, phosphate regulon sensor histidine kinase PhoR